ncbi:hypothetical protein D3C74_329840 [compost metagenome]
MGRRKKPKRGRPISPLDDRHYLAIELLTRVPTPNLDEIARACGVDRRTLYTWRHRKDFEREFMMLARKKADERYRRFRAKQKYVLSSGEIEETFRILGLISE